MIDDADDAFYQSAAELDSLVGEARRKAAIPPGAPGVCRFCGEESKRLIGGACAPCRDENGLP
jgi:hypothetical protein